MFSVASATGGNVEALVPINTVLIPGILASIFRWCEVFPKTIIGVIILERSLLSDNKSGTIANASRGPFWQRPEFVVIVTGIGWGHCYDDAQPTSETDSLPPILPLGSYCTAATYVLRRTRQHFRDHHNKLPTGISNSHTCWCTSIALLQLPEEQTTGSYHGRRGLLIIISG